MTTPHAHTDATPASHVAGYAWTAVDPSHNVIDLFAGPGGWDYGLREHLGVDDVLGIEWDDAACATRKAAGLRTLQADVTTLDPRGWPGVRGLIASPPCPDFSMAGNRAGLKGESGRLMLEVPRWVEGLSPDWVACEQVPPALSIYEEFAHQLREWGYETWTGVLNAADYGVPQTRQRAFLLAARWPVSPPETTHAPHPTLMGHLPWVSMADAVGWGYDHRPSPTVTAGGTKTGGAEPFGHHGRKALERWVVDRRTNSNDGRGGMVPTVTVPMDRPAPTLTGKGGHQWVMRCGEKTRKLTVADAAVLQSFPADHPFQGNKGKQFEQVGNAVPPLLAAHVVSAVARVPFLEKVTA